MIDHLHRNLPALWRIERATLRRVQRRPGRFVDLSAQRVFEPLIRIACAGEVGVPRKETLAVVVGVDELSRQVHASIILCLHCIDAPQLAHYPTIALPN